MSNATGASLRPARRPDFGAEALVYIERARQLTKRLRAFETNPEDVRGALQHVRNVATFDVEVPTLSTKREVQLVKTGVKRLSGWYMRYLSSQLNAFGASVVRLGEAISSRVENMELGRDELIARVGAVEERLKRLERPDDSTTGNTTGRPASRGPRKDTPRED